MSYQPHRLNEFIPTYVPHSDYLPSNQVVDNRQNDVQAWVYISQCSLNNTKMEKLKDKCSLKDPLSSIPEDMFQLELTKM